MFACVYFPFKRLMMPGEKMLEVTGEQRTGIHWRENMVSNVVLLKHKALSFKI